MGQPQIQPGGVFDVAAPIPDLERHGRLPDVQPRDARRLRVPRDEGRHGKLRVCKRADCGEVLDR